MKTTFKNLEELCISGIHAFEMTESSKKALTLIKHLRYNKVYQEKNKEFAGLFFNYSIPNHLIKKGLPNK